MNYIKAWEFQHPNFKYNRRELLEDIKVHLDILNNISTYYSSVYVEKTHWKSSTSNSIISNI